MTDLRAHGLTAFFARAVTTIGDGTYTVPSAGARVVDPMNDVTMVSTSGSSASLMLHAVLTSAATC